ncbi:hypothetical protein [Streptomyces globisporus]|uniref:hypothetical protein n=1 Tax=Streptomyces globisporus TaxID=1908 RepID=UPI00382141BB
MKHQDNQPAKNGERERIANDELAHALAGRPLINFDRHTTAGRIAYAGPIGRIAAARPALSLGYYSSWDPAAAHRTISAETGTSLRDGEERKKNWWPRITDRAVSDIRSLEHPPVVAGWWALPELHDLASPHGIVAGIPATVRHNLEEKTSLERVLRSAGVSRRHIIRARVYRGQLPSLTDMRSAVGTRRIVVQSGHSGGGRGTVFVENESGMKQASRLPGPWRVSAFVEGWNSNTTVLSIPDNRGGVRVYVDRPSHMAVDIAALGISIAKSAGHQWATEFPSRGVHNLIEAVTRIGKWAWRTHGLFGLWGVDTIWTTAGPVINEINARKQATTEISGVNQQLAGYPPLAVAHLTTMLGSPVSWLPHPDEFNTLTLKAAHGNAPAPYYLKVRTRQEVTTPHDFPGSGIYRIDGERLVWERAGAHPAEANTDRGLVLIANAPAPGTVCQEGAELATIEGISEGPALPFAGPRELSRRGKAILHAFENIFVPAAKC